jgi:hypothetical protein
MHVCTTHACRYADITKSDKYNTYSVYTYTKHNTYRIQDAEFTAACSWWNEATTSIHYYVYIYILYVAGQTILPSWMIKDSSQKQRRSALISNSKMVSYSLIYIACTVKPLETYMYTTHTYSALLWYYVTVVRKHT